MQNAARPNLNKCLQTIGIAVAAMASPSHAQASSAPTPGPVNSDTQCAAILKTDFAQVEDAPAKMMTAGIVPGAGSMPRYCEVIGYAWHDVQFRVRMPLAGWNGKIVVFGTGGQAGSFSPDDPTAPLSPSGSALRLGFATATHNGGHVSTELDAQWSYQNEAALLDYGFRAPHVTGLVARAVVARFYGIRAKRAYFDGCSNGGREALQMVQRYPYDYDGIIAGAPSMRWSELFANLYWFTNRTSGSKAVLDVTALQLLHRYVLDQCDRIDGKLDSIIDDPQRCHIDLAPITCATAASTICLNPAQARAAREIYDGPHDPSGRRIAYSSAMPGSELVWGTYPGIESYPPSVFRYQSFMPAPGPGFIPDEKRLGEYVRRSGGSDAILAATNPDIRRFRDNGGKLLSYMGWNDPIGGIRETIEYHATVERVVGGKVAMQDFYRLFMVPGMNHCSGGDGASQIDWLAALDAWVDGHKVPDAITGYHPGPDGKPTFVRTIVPFVAYDTPKFPAGDAVP